ncbi:MAG: hypothetical protein DRJ47_06490 [Thermoprotei archaeon]|nr:MAG: hypothetical protein DRJ47_06490 [Thermoprotei archaeon]
MSLLTRVLVVLLLLVLSYAFCEADETRGDEPIVCFTEKTASRMVVEIEKCRITTKQIELLAKENEELRKQVEYLKTIVELQKKELETSRQTIENLRKIIDYQSEAYKKLHKESILDKVKENSLFLSIGILIGVAASL